MRIRFDVISVLTAAACGALSMRKSNTIDVSTITPSFVIFLLLLHLKFVKLLGNIVDFYLSPQREDLLKLFFSYEFLHGGNDCLSLGFFPGQFQNLGNQLIGIFNVARI